MKFTQAVSTSLLGLSLSAIGLPALARPEIASGDQWLEGVSQQSCLQRADAFITELGVTSDGGELDRTGYFDDGAFRILCYSAGESSMAIVFAVHDNDLDVATQFMQFALEEISN